LILFVFVLPRQTSVHWDGAVHINVLTHDYDTSKILWCAAACTRSGIVLTKAELHPATTAYAKISPLL